MSVPCSGDLYMLVQSYSEISTPRELLFVCQNIVN